MKKLALATAFLFASSMFVMAQSTGSPSSTDQQQPSATSPSSSPSASPSSTDQQSPSSASPSSSPSQSDQSAQSSMGSSSEQKIEGCLSQGANGFTLADASGTSYNLTGDTSKLSSHVGEQVEIKGAPSSGSSAASSGAASSSAASGASPSSASGQNFEVKSVKKIAKSCSTSGASSTPK